MECGVWQDGQAPMMKNPSVPCSLLWIWDVIFLIRPGVMETVKVRKFSGKLSEPIRIKSSTLQPKCLPKTSSGRAGVNSHLTTAFHPIIFKEYVEKSLYNAGLDSFDLMQFHTWEDSWLGDDRGIKKMMELKEQGLFHSIGISMNRWEPWNGIKAVKSGLIDVVQVIYNIFDQNPKDELFPASIRAGGRSDGPDCRAPGGKASGYQVGDRLPGHCGGSRNYRRKRSAG